MIKRLQFLFRHYWVEMVMTPPFLVALCWFLYGDTYFSSSENFMRLTLPWLPMCILSPICCHWARNMTLRRFPRLEDWPKRVLWSLVGYLISTVGFAKLTYFVLTHTRSLSIRVEVMDKPYYEETIRNHAEIVPSTTAFFGLLLLSTMCTLIIGTLYEGITYFNKWKNALTETEQLEKLHLETQFQSLQSQLNPHFLFNSLNVLSSLIAENPRRAEDFVDELSNVYRYLLRSNERELASVEEELRFIRSFFHLLKTRHDTGIVLKTKVSSENLSKQLPALALQILIENAVKHNEVSPEKPLEIEIFTQQCTPPPQSKMGDCSHGSQLIVRNNVQRKSARPQSNRVGLDNLRQRYELLGVTGFVVHDDGHFFNVMLPLLDGH